MKKPRVVVVDYGIGNLFSIRRAFEHCGAEVLVTERAAEIENAERLVLPGVGAFSDGMAGLRERGLADAVIKHAKSQRMFLGICLGMQMMMDHSEEFGSHPGLGLVPGKVVAIPHSHGGVRHKIPHIGWNALLRPAHADWEGTLLSETTPGQAVYFVHSFMALPDDEGQRLAECLYSGIIIPSVIRSGNLYGCQFHPEKSGPVGLGILDTFCKAQPVALTGDRS